MSVYKGKNIPGTRAWVAAEAKRHGIKKFVYHPCPTCGGTLFYSSTNGCVECQKRRSKKWQRDNYDQFREGVRSWVGENRDYVNQQRRVYYRKMYWSEEDDTFKRMQNLRSDRVYHTKRLAWAREIGDKKRIHRHSTKLNQIKQEMEKLT